MVAGSRIWWLVVLAALGCGRRNFNARGDGGIDGGFDAGEPPANLVFVTSTSHVPGAFGGLAGADAICAERAAAGGLSGTFIAYLSTPTVDARDRLSGARGWIRPDGRPVVDRVDELIQGQMLHPIRIDENGDDVGTAAPLVATGSTPDGGVDSDTCGEYDDTGLNIELGEPYGTGDRFSSQSEGSCADPYRLYCFGTDLNEPLQLTPAEGRLAFVSLSPFVIGGGIESADQQCGDDAQAAGFPGTYKALLSTSTFTAASRFDLGGQNWVRVDGIPVADSPLAFMTSQHQASLDVNAASTFVTGRVWTGSASPQELGSTNSSCSEWLTTGVNGEVGRVNSSDPGGWWDVGGTEACNQTGFNLYCLQE